MVKMQKTLGILLALCFLLSVTAGAASAYGCNDGCGKEKCGHHAEFGHWKKSHHAEFCQCKMVGIYCSDDNNGNCNDDEDDDNNDEDC